MIQQNTPEWLQIRKDKIGASDAPIIMEASPYKTPYQLWEEKLDLVASPSMTSKMQRGHDLEDQARQELEKITGLFFLPQVMFHTELPWMMASLDAIDAESQYIAEIKCPGKEDHSVAVNGKIPEKYFPQLQHQLEVSQVEMGYYFSFDGVKGILVKFYRDDAYIKKMIKKEQQFWECMQSFIAPEMSERDYVQKTDDFWDNSAREWREINEQLKALEAKEKQIRKNLIALSEQKNTIGAGIRLTRSLRKGNVDYSVIPELQSIDLEKYRKDPIESYRITAI